MAMKSVKFTSARGLIKALVTLGASSLTVSSPAPAKETTTQAEGTAALRVVVRDADATARRNKFIAEQYGAEGDLFSIPYAPGLELVLVLDEPMASKVVGAGKLAELGLTQDEAMALGRRQVLAILPSIPSVDDINGGILKSPQIDNIGSLMLADGWDELDKALAGQLLVAVPSDDVIVVANLASEQKRSDFKLYVKQLHDDATRSVSPFVYARQSGSWVQIP
jgi:hypothetical protein